MDIYRDYTTLDVIANKPCYIEKCGYIYPIKVKDYVIFQKKHNLFFTYTPTYLKALVPDEITKSSLQKTIILSSRVKQQEYFEFGKSKSNEEILLEILNDLCNAFSIVTQKEIKYLNGEFTDISREVTINDKNFNFVKKVVALSNMIYQPTYYKNEEYARIMEKAKKAHSKGGIGLDEMIAYVKNNGNLTYDEILNQNVFQLNCDYYCQSTKEWYRTAMNFRCVSTDKSLSNVKLTPSFINKMFDTSDNHLFKTIEELGFIDN